MITGIGTDIVKIERMRSAVERWGGRFLDRIFTPREIEHCYERREPYASLAVRFAAKEALLKAVGTRGITYRAIEVSNAPDGKPFINSAGFSAVLESREITTLHLSLSHEREFGIAVVVAER